MAIEKIKESTWEAMRRKSAASLPDNPTARGWSAEEIRRTLYAPLFDKKDSFKALLMGLIDELRELESQCGAELSWSDDGEGNVLVVLAGGAGQLLLHDDGSGNITMEVA